MSPAKADDAFMVQAPPNAWCTRPGAVRLSVMSLSSSTKRTALRGAAPGGGVWRPLPGGLLLQQGAHNFREGCSQVLSGSGITAVLNGGRKHKRTKAIPVGAELGNDDSRQVVGEFVAFIRTQEGFARPELLDLRWAPELAMTRMHLLRR